MSHFFMSVYKVTVKLCQNMTHSISLLKFSSRDNKFSDMSHDLAYDRETFVWKTAAAHARRTHNDVRKF